MESTLSLLLGNLGTLDTSGLSLFSLSSSLFSSLLSSFPCWLSIFFFSVSFSNFWLQRSSFLDQVQRSTSDWSLCLNGLSRSLLSNFFGDTLLVMLSEQDGPSDFLGFFLCLTKKQIWSFPNLKILESPRTNKVPLPG